MLGLALNEPPQAVGQPRPCEWRSPERSVRTLEAVVALDPDEIVAARADKASIDLTLRFGCSRSLANLQTLSNATARTLLRGTPCRSRLELDDALRELGSHA